MSEIIERGGRASDVDIETATLPRLPAGPGPGADVSDEAKFATVLGYELGVAEGWREAIEALRAESQRWRGLGWATLGEGYLHAADYLSTLTPEDKP